MTSIDQAKAIQRNLTHFLQQSGMSERQTYYLAFIAIGLSLLLLSYFTFVLIQRLLRKILYRASKRTHYPIYLILDKNKIPFRSALLSSILLFAVCIPYLPIRFVPGFSIAAKLIEVLSVICIAALIHALLKSAKDALQKTHAFRDKPLASYLQVVSIVLIFVAGLAIISRLTGISVFAFITAMGAASAVLLIVFKDSILGFVASIQVTTNDMVRMGDWIEMPKYGADGDVVNITINTVKVQNWDKTITTIPTYALIADSFRNWRGMQDSGGRRIKRSLNIKIASIRFLEDEELEQFAKIERIREYVTRIRAEIKKDNETKDTDRTLLLNGRNLTNIGLFRQYSETYLSEHKMINKEMTCMVRQLKPDENGIPVEIYAFTNDTRWAKYENILSDIFDHLLAAVTYFDLNIHETPASDDIRQLTASLAVELTTKRNNQNTSLPL